MRIQGFEWNDGSIEHIARHGVTPEEAEEAMNTNVFRRTHSDRYAAFGQTSASRYLTVIFALGPGRVARVITAREMDDKERRYYNRERRG